MLDDLNEEWREHPPVHHLVAAYLQYRPAHRWGDGSAEEQALRAKIPRVDNAPRLDTTEWDAYVKTLQ